MKIYLVVADTWTHGYGSKNYLIGAFSSEEEAERVRAGVLALNDENEDDDILVSINTIELDKSYSLVLDTDSYYDPTWTNENYLGGYIE